MSPEVHLVLSQKGGTGKTTLAVNLAAVTADVLCGDRELNSVLVVSIDPQASTVWWSDRIEATPFDFAQVDNDPGQLDQLPCLTQYRHVFIDTAGSIADSEQLQKALEVADDVIVPLPPEPLAYDPTRRTIERVIQPRALPYHVVVNNWDPRDGERDRDQTIAYVDNRGWPRTHVVVRHYKIHTRAAAEGRVVTQYPKNRASWEAREDFFRLALELGLGGGAPASAVHAAVAGVAS
jgi:chromosome partitioning protein